MRYPIRPLAVLALLASATSASAATVYGVNILTRPIDDPNVPDQLVRFDSSNPAGYTVVGSLGIPRVSMGGLDFDEAGNLYAFAALDKFTTGAVSQLYSINKDTGAATPIGPERLTYVNDIAWNPATHKMYGIDTRSLNRTDLFEINLATGLPTKIGSFTGLPGRHYIQGLAIDAGGNFYLHDVLPGRGESDPYTTPTDFIYKAGPNLAATPLYHILDTGFAQGMTIDWSGSGLGFHNAVGQGEFPNYYSLFNTFTTDGSGYTVGPEFGPNEMIGQFGYPPLELADLAVLPTLGGAVPEPGSLALIGCALPLLTARRRPR